MKNYFFNFCDGYFYDQFKLWRKTVNNSDQQNVKTEWKLLMEKDGVQIYYVYENCDDVTNDIHEENAVLKFVNTTDKNLIIDWDLKIWYNGSCVNCDKNDAEHHFSIQLSAGETKKGSCETRNLNRDLLIFSKFLNMETKSKLTKFELQNISVKLQ